jgi:hypothetical protein
MSLTWQRLAEMSLDRVELSALAGGGERRCVAVCLSTGGATDAMPAVCGKS